MRFIIRILQFACKHTVKFILNTYVNVHFALSKRLRREQARYQKQNRYLIDHIAPAKLKPATGELRDFQLKLLNYCYTLIQEFEQQGIQYFLTGGNLIGALRHSGYIPWDDDFDIAMMRPDYEKCINYARHKFINIDTSHLVAFKGGEPYYPVVYQLWDTYLKKNPHQTLYFQYGEHTQLITGTSIADCVSLDIFVWDFYDDAYTLAQHKAYVKKLKQQEIRINNVALIDAYFNKQMQNYPYIAKRSDTIFYGIGDSENWANMTKNVQFLRYNQIYPLKKVPFEDKYLSVPQDAIACVTNLYGKNWNKLPYSINGNSEHRSYRISCVP